MDLRLIWLLRDHYSFMVNGQRLFIFSGEVSRSIYHQEKMHS